MKRKLLLLIFSICALSGFWAFWGINSDGQIIEKQGEKILSIRRAKIQNNEAPNNLNETRRVPQIAPLQLTTLVRVNSLKPSTAELREEVRKGKEKIDRERLIERLNRGEIPSEEMETVKNLFEKMAFMSLESARRRMEELEPEFERGLARIDERLEKIKGIIKE